jgi:ribulose-phosphate 3-epimerase
MFISASVVFGKNFDQIPENISSLEDLGINWFHIDSSDGYFSPNLTFGPMVLKSLRKKCRSFIEVHALIQDPLKYINDFKEAGADSIIIHYEADKNPQLTLREIRKLGLKAGLAINPGTDVSVVKWMLEDMDLLSIVGVYPGYPNQKITPRIVAKIRAAKEILMTEGFESIVLEGCGVSSLNIADMLDAGCDVLVSGKDLLNAPSFKEKLAEYQRLAGERVESKAAVIAKSWKHEL